MSYNNPYRLPPTQILKQAVGDLMEYRESLTQARLRIRTCNVLSVYADDCQEEFLAAILMRGVVPDCEIAENYPQAVIDYVDALSGKSKADISKLVDLYYLASEVAAMGMSMDNISKTLKRDLEPIEQDVENLINFSDGVSKALKNLGSFKQYALRKFVKSELKYAREFIDTYTDPQASSACKLKQPPKGVDARDWIQKNGRKLI